MDKPRAAFFDIDHTVIRGSSARHFLLKAFRKKLIPFRMLFAIPFYYFQYRFMHPEWEQWTKKFRHFAGIDYQTVCTISGECFEIYKKTIFPEIAAIIKEYKEQGCPVYFATSSIDIFIEPFISYFQADGLIASKLEFEDDKTSGGFLGEPAFGKEKLKKVLKKTEELGLNLADCAFYSDSIHDSPLLEAVGFPVAVNPDSKLKRLALKKNWTIIEPHVK